MSVRQNIGGLRNLVSIVRNLDSRTTNAPYTTISTAAAQYNSIIKKAEANNILIVNVHLWGDTRYKVGK